MNLNRWSEPSYNLTLFSQVGSFARALLWSALATSSSNLQAFQPSLNIFIRVEHQFAHFKFGVVVYHGLAFRFLFEIFGNTWRNSTINGLAHDGQRLQTQANSTYQIQWHRQKHAFAESIPQLARRTLPLQLRQWRSVDNEMRWRHVHE